MINIKKNQPLKLYSFELNSPEPSNSVSHPNHITNKESDPSTLDFSTNVSNTRHSTLCSLEKMLQKKLTNIKHLNIRK